MRVKGRSGESCWVVVIGIVVVSMNVVLIDGGVVVVGVILNVVG